MKKFAFIAFTLCLFAACKKNDKDSNPTTTTADGKFSVAYNANGGDGSVPKDANRYDSGASAVISDNTGNLTKSGYAFVGWNMRADGTGTDVMPGSAFTIINNTTLYAKWLSSSSNNLFQVTYNGNGNTSGTAPVDNTSYVSGSQFIVKDNTGGLQQNSSSFLKWNTSPAGIGFSYSPGEKINIAYNVTLFAVYSSSNTSGGKYYGFNASGQMKSKSSLNSSWSSEDLDDTFGSSNVVSVVWNGSKFVGFNASGQAKSKSSASSSWSAEDLDHTFGSSDVVSVVWNGSKFVGFNASGQAKSKSSASSSWSAEDLDHTFGSSDVVSVVWNGSKYIGFNESGQPKSKSSLSGSWGAEDLTHTFGESTLVSVVWNGSKYIGFNATGQAKSKSTLSSSWSTEDQGDLFGSSNLSCATFK